MELAEFGSSEFTPPKRMEEEEVVKLQDLEKTVRDLLLPTYAPEGDDGLQLPDVDISFSETEVRAFLQPHDREQSFRSQYAGSLRALCVIQIRLASELKRYVGRSETTYLWQEHVSVLNFLLRRATEALESACSVSGLAAQRGMMEHVLSLAASRDRLEKTVREANDTIRQRTLLLSHPPPAFVYKDDRCLLD
jgi:hypothetical protein